MDKSDLKEIKFGGKAFSKIWWEKHRAMSLKGSKIGDLLEDFGKLPKASELTNEPDINNAEGTCGALLQALRGARTKLGRFADETGLAIDAYEKIAVGCQKDLKRARRELLKSNVGGNLEKADTLTKQMETSSKEGVRLLKEMDEICKRGATYETEIRNRLSGKVVKDVKELASVVQKDAQASSTTYDWTQDTNHEVLGKANITAEQLSKVKDKAVVKRVLEFDKAIRVFADLMTRVEERAADARQVSEDCVRLVENGAPTRERYEGELETKRVAFFENPAGNPEDAGEHYGKLVRCAQAVAALAKKSELSEDDVGELDEVKTQILATAGQLEQTVGFLVRFFKQTHKLVSGNFKDDKVGNQVLQEMGGKVAEVQKHLKKWKSIEKQVLDTLDALALKAAE